VITGIVLVVVGGIVVEVVVDVVVIAGAARVVVGAVVVDGADEGVKAAGIVVAPGLSELPELNVQPANAMTVANTLTPIPARLFTGELL
jgi:hypothetical protein